MMEIKGTEKLYAVNSYEREFTAFVQSCTKDGDTFKVVLSKTAFFPEGGGQYGDTGVLMLDSASVDVIDTQIENGIIYHYTKSPLKEGTTVCGKIDWDKRFVRMQNHTGEHIVSGIVNAKFGYDNIGFHLGDDDVTCDYNGSLSWDAIKEIEYEANTAVFKNIEVCISYPDNDKLSKMHYRSKLDLEDGVRLVTIPGVDCCACCAPHVKSTGEVGLIKIVNMEKSHGGTRLHLRCGYAALADYDEKQIHILRITDLLSARQFETADAVEKLQMANGALSNKLSQASVRLAEQALSAAPNVAGNMVMYIEDADTDALRALANGGREKCSGCFVALTNSPDGYRYMITGNNMPLSTLAREFNSLLVGRGGGKDDMIQGVFSSELTVIQDFFDNWSYSS